MNRKIIINAPGKVSVAESNMPVPAKGEALLRLLYGGVCGSDLGSYRGTFAYVSYPRTPGHEFSAEIVEIDENEAGFRPGMLVTANPYFNCGKCYSCRRGLVNCCEDNQTMGVQREGAFSQYITMPIERLYDGSGLSAQSLALIEPFCISYHGILRAEPKAGDRVLIVGGGTIGLLAAIVSNQLGADVFLCDVSPEKLKIAEAFGIRHTFLNDETFSDQVLRFTNKEGFDITVEAVGLPSTFQNCIDAAAFGGKVVVIGVGKQNLDFNFTIIQKKELHILGSRNACKKDFEQAIELVRTGKICIDQIISKIFPMQDASAAFEQLDREAGKLLKILFEF